MFSALSTPVPMEALTLEAVRQATGLDWVQVDLAAPELPAEQGVYAWADAADPNALWYHGSGSGQGGLRARLTNQLRWRTNQRTRAMADPASLSEQDAFDLAREVPAVQQAAKERQLHYAIAKPAPWTVERSEIVPPAGALEWEAFISAVSLLITGHRGLVGGGAWESKAGTIGHRMTDLAWDRLVDLQGGTWQ